MTANNNRDMQWWRNNKQIFAQMDTATTINNINNIQNYSNNNKIYTFPFYVEPANQLNNKTFFRGEKFVVEIIKSKLYKHANAFSLLLQFFWHLLFYEININVKKINITRKGILDWSCCIFEFCF